ncbi:hypothetical protein ESY86_16185 [Subsaximicrobium wynnwilliamsii]|uniref:PEGA domain-containing protein n=1 Tax=Subsaximicrobium wynnwilliamsii TaxID=291179 RepID=A0A5C6ZC08_9FLAO|nr:hypothetical protein [Subsaximicrobium wynnwilliamsii]TXD81749.1 hypothetical protein ESY87_16680 [Subsaximicrobium wynnwilliamsii]TXD87575.1 hypothetical protein ESY86_16185 [Subsaximicrobium wynnwilliamsii]TXE01248.1 hypothetical protein ESY88_16435 [Subsaximicrobium wynnwilliamsii]
MPKLTINRKSETNNKARKIGVYIDGIRVGSIANGESQSYEVLAGRHEVSAKIDWCGSQIKSIDLKDSQTQTLALAGFKYGSVAGIVMLLFFGSYLIGKYVFDLKLYFLIVGTVLTFCYPLYFITFGRNHYLKLSEVTAAEI